MNMRYHWGLAVGHIYAHEQSAVLGSFPGASTVEEVTSGPETDADVLMASGSDDHASDYEDGEFGFENREDDEWDHDDDDDDDDLDRLDLLSDEEFISMHDMYGL
jgi:hypothetical protein